MRIPRIYQPIPLSRDQVIELDAQATVHLARVLRLKPGDELVVFNGEGGEYRAAVETVSRRTARIRLDEFVDRSVESPLELVLVQGVSRGERMDYTVQKAVELGVTRIIPVLTERTVVNIEGERQERRRMHWQSIAISACEQSGRTRVPEISSIMALYDWLGMPDEGARFVLHHRAESSFNTSGNLPTSITLLIGPEGGLSKTEITAACSTGYCPIRLGQRVLRTETAAVTALSILQWLWGDLGNR